MSDYQAIYDAVRSRISGGNIGEIIADVARDSFDISNYIRLLHQEFNNVAMEMQRPFVLLKPKMFMDGNAWCALYGENIQDGVAGFGKTPSEAALNFDTCFYKGSDKQT